MLYEFQFLKGAIKGPLAYLSPVIASLFQFLKGAIKGEENVLDPLFGIQFQFLKGAIKGSHSGSFALSLCNFNS